MLDTLDHNRRLGNGKDGPHIRVQSGMGLGNTNPIATLAPTSGSGATMVAYHEEVGRGARFVEDILRSSAGPKLVAQTGKGADTFVFGRASERDLIIEFKVPQATRALKPAGQVVLFRKIMEDWNFSDQDAATLLGFETASDIGEIYLGMKTAGHRDANDRLRAVLRIAADLDALFQDVTAIRDWLSELQRDLGGATPRSLLTEGSMENLLRVKYFVAYLSGR